MIARNTITNESRMRQAGKSCSEAQRAGPRSLHLSFCLQICRRFSKVVRAKSYLATLLLTELLHPSVPPTVPKFTIQQRDHTHKHTAE